MFSDPVVGKNFFGRQEVVDLLIKRASALKSGYRQNVALIGHQQLGKTSILRQFLHVFRDPQVLCIYVEIKLQALDYFVEQFVRSVLYQYLIQASDIPPTETLKNLTEQARPHIPRTVARIGEIAQLLKTRHAEEAYSKLFELTQILKEETGLNTIVILDEFHRLGEFGIRNAFSDFGKRIMVQKDTMYVLSSSSFSQSRKILAEKLALLFGNFERVYLEAFDFETSFGYIAHKLEPLRLSNTLRTFLVSWTDGHPFFLETLVSRIKELALSRAETEVSSHTVAEVFLKMFYESQGVLHQYFSKLISPWTQAASKGSHLLILSEIARGNNKLKSISLAVNRSQREVQKQINELSEHELLIKSGIFYRFHSKTFRFWLKEVYVPKELSLLNTGDKSERFLQRVLSLIDDEEALIKMDVGDRLIALLSDFQNDLVEMGEKKRKLPHFSEIIKKKTEPTLFADAPSRDLIAKGHGRCWVCKITEEKATERQVMDLVMGTKNKKDSHTKVLLALNGVDDNAKLLAKDKRVLTLSLSRINFLMDLYDKPPIIQWAPATK